MKKRWISLLLTMCLLLTAIPIQVFAATGLPFRDVPDGAWYLPAVRYAYDEKIMTGTSGNTFEPESRLTRAQMTQILYNMEGQPSVNGDAFSDVQNGDWFFKAVNWAASQGVVNGVGGGRFDPNSSITREQMVVMLCNYANYKDNETDDLVDLSAYTDAASISDYAYAPLQWAVGEGIISGVTETTIQPKGTATRAQVAQVLMTFCQNKEALDTFLAKDVDDFEGQTVLQYTESEETNFSVLADDIIIANASNGVNRMVSENDETGVYVIDQADATIKGLKPGDKLFIPYKTDYFMVKVGTAKTNGSRVTITAADAVLDDFFSYIDINMDVVVPADQLEAPQSEASSTPAATNPSPTPAPAPSQESQEQGENDSESPSVEEPSETPNIVEDGVVVFHPYEGEGVIDPSDSLLYKNTQQPILREQIGGEWEHRFNVKHSTGSFTASLDMLVTVTARVRYDKWIWRDLDIKLAVKQETTGKVEVTAATTDDPYKEELGSFSIPIAFPFEAEISFFASSNVKAAASGNITANFMTEFGGIYKDGDFKAINDSDASLTADISGTVTASAGIGAEGGLNCDIKAVEVGVSLSGEAGVTISGKAEKLITTDREPIKHICPLCIDGNVDFYLNADLNVYIDLALVPKWNKPINLWDKTIPFKDFYISFGGGDVPIEFDWGDCPHYQYLVTIRTEDQTGAAVPDAAITIDGPTDASGSTDGNGTFYTYCDNGSYTVLADGPEGYGNAGGSFKVNNKAVDIDLSLTKEGVFVPFTLTGDLYDAMDGLYDGDNRIGTVRADIVSPTEMHITLADMEPVMGLNRHTNYSVSISPGSYEWTANFYVEIGGSYPTRTSAGFYSPDVSGGSDYFTVSNPKLDTQKKQLTWTVKVNSGVDFDFSQLYGTNISAITNQKT